MAKIIIEILNDNSLKIEFQGGLNPVEALKILTATIQETLHRLVPSGGAGKTGIIRPTPGQVAKVINN